MPRSARVRRIGGMGALLRVRAGAEGPRRAADGCHPGCAPGRCRGCAALFRHTPAQAAHPEGGRRGHGLVGHRRLGAQHHARWGGPCAGARLALAVGSPRCSKIARPLRLSSRTPAPGVCLHSGRKRTRPVRTSCGAARPNPIVAGAPSSAPPPSRQRTGSPPPALPPLGRVFPASHPALAS